MLIRSFVYLIYCFQSQFFILEFFIRQGFIIKIVGFINFLKDACIHVEMLKICIQIWFIIFLIYMKLLPCAITSQFCNTSSMISLILLLSWYFRLYYSFICMLLLLAWYFHLYNSFT